MKITTGKLPDVPDIIERAHLEVFGVNAGVKLLDVVEGAPLFNYVEFPSGWKKIPNKPLRCKDLIDDRGRKRATVHVNYMGGGYKCLVWPLGRFQVSHTYNTDDDIVVGSVRDDGKLIYTTESIKWEGLSWLDVEEAGRAWLDKNYPNWRKYGAYWD